MTDVEFLMDAEQEFDAPEMKRRDLLAGLGAGAAMAAGFTSAAEADGHGAHQYDLDDMGQRLDAYIKVVSDLSGAEVVTFARSKIYCMVPGMRGFHMFNLEVFGVKRHEKMDYGYRRIQREIAYYRDVETDEILTSWANPFIERDVEVVPILNDPVNRELKLAGEGRKWNVPYTELSGNVIFHREVPLRYRNALPMDEYPIHSHGNWYEAAELFNNFTTRAAIEDPDTTSAPATGSWSRVGPWLPWMEMGNRKGHLLYHGHSVKLMGGLDDLPRATREYTEKNYPKYLSAPDEWKDPSQSETSWTYFKKIIDAKRGG